HGDARDEEGRSKMEPFGIRHIAFCFRKLVASRSRYRVAIHIHATDHTAPHLRDTIVMPSAKRKRWRKKRIFYHLLRSVFVRKCDTMESSVACSKSIDASAGKKSRVGKTYGGQRTSYFNGSRSGPGRTS